MCSDSGAFRLQALIFVGELIKMGVTKRTVAAYDIGRQKRNNEESKSN